MFQFPYMIIQNIHKLYDLKITPIHAHIWILWKVVKNQEFMSALIIQKELKWHTFHIGNIQSQYHSSLIKHCTILHVNYFKSLWKIQTTFMLFSKNVTKNLLQICATVLKIYYVVEVL